MTRTLLTSLCRGQGAMGFLDRASCADPNACVGVLEEGHCVCYSDRLAQPARAVAGVAE